MDFTAGKRRQYERLMKEKPNFTRNDDLPEEDEREPRRHKQQTHSGNRTKKRPRRRNGR